MRYVDLSPNGAAYIPIYLASSDGKTMVKTMFLLDTGATRTTINFKMLSKLGYTKEWVEENKIILSESEKPMLADGRKLNAYGIPAIRMSISGHEVFHNDYFITSDEAPNLGFLLGADILSYFDIFFKYSEWRAYFEFREDRIKRPSKPGDSFAYAVDN